MNLFDMIPKGFFNLLGSGANNRIYSDCLSIIYEEYDREITFRIGRERLRDAIAVYLADNQISNVEEVPEAKEQGLSYSDLASDIIRRFCSPETGWLEEETDDATYARNIIMTESGLKLAEFLEQLKQPEKAEFSSYIYNIFNTLSNEEQWGDNIYVGALKNVYRNAKGLSKDLKTLATFIKKIIERMVHEESFESLTENLLEYLNGDFIREYSRLTKKQNIRTFRRVILKRLGEMLNNEETFDKLIQGCIDEERVKKDRAYELVSDMFDSTRRFLDSDYDRIMNDIKHKINVYLQVAVGRARFIRNKEENIRGDIERTLRYISRELNDENMVSEIPAFMHGLFDIENNEFIDLSSVSYPRISRNIKKNSEQELIEVSEDDIEQAKRDFARETDDTYSKEKMARYLKDILNGRKSISADRLPLNDKTELLKTLSAVVYADENGFDVEILDGYYETDKMILRNIIISDREKQ